MFFFLALDLALEFLVVAFRMEVDEDGFMAEVGNDETADLVVAYRKYRDSRSGNGLEFVFVGVGAGSGNVDAGHLFLSVFCV